MADLPEFNEWTPGVYQLETSDPVLGGPEGIDNRQAKQLANRTKWLKDQLQKLIDGVTSVGKAAQLATERTLKFKGAASGSGTYDGSADTEITLTLADSGVVGGSYTKVTLNAKGLVTGGSNPTTLDGYGITDAMTVEQVNQALENKADKASTLAGYGILDTYDAETIDQALLNKANKANSLAGYGISDAIAEGQHGLGATVIAAGAIDYKDLPGGFYSIEDQWSSFGSFLSVLNLPSWAKGFPAQLGIEVGGAQAKAFIRSAGIGGEWLPPSELWTSANFNPTTKLDSAGIVMSLGTNGFLAFPFSLGRLIIQWGTVAAQSQTAHTITFPQAYNSACFGVITSVNNSAGSNSADSGYQVISKTNQNFIAFRQDYNTISPGGDSGYTWFSFGV